MRFFISRSYRHAFFSKDFSHTRRRSSIVYRAFGAIFSACCEACGAGRFIEPNHAGLFQRQSGSCLAGFNRAAWLSHSDRYIPAEVVEAHALFQQIQQFTYALFGVLSPWLCHSRHQLYQEIGPDRIPWLCAFASWKCTAIVPSYPRKWQKQHKNHH